MKKISKEAAKAFVNFQSFKRSNTEVVVNKKIGCVEMFLHGNMIAKAGSNNLQTTLFRSDFVVLSSCGYLTNATKERLNALLKIFEESFLFPNYHSCKIIQRNFRWFLQTIVPKHSNDLYFLIPWKKVVCQWCQIVNLPRKFNKYAIKTRYNKPF